MNQKKDEERDLCIALSLVPFLQPLQLRLIYEHFDSLKDLARASPTLLAALLNLPEEKARLVKNPLQLHEIRDRVEELREEAVTLVDESYPALLREIGDQPAALFFRGNPRQAQGPAVAIVGSRAASRYAIAAAEALTRDLVRAGLTIVSGLARGVDSAAHRAALRCGGKTVAVLGAGLDADYPKENRSLRNEIENSGCVLTEFPPGTPPRANHFPVRNRIIAGLSAGVVVIEATDRSGSLITARLAAEQGREVFALPGSIFQKGSLGPHRLIQYGAKLVHDVDDVLEEIVAFLPQKSGVQSQGSGIGGRGSGKKTEPEVAEELRPLFAILSVDEPVHIDEASRRLSEPVATIAGKLLTLELEGLIHSLPGGNYVRV